MIIILYSRSFGSELIGFSFFCGTQKKDFEELHCVRFSMQLKMD